MQKIFRRGKSWVLKKVKNLHFIHGVGVDLNKYKKKDNNLREKLNLSNKSRVAVCVAEFIANKNHMQLLNAWKYVCNKEPDSVLFTGWKGKIENKIRKAVIELGISQNVYF